MADININEYVRTISGNIDKVDALIGMIENTVHLEKHKWQDIKNIVKHSPNIIDLIEEGDYVNGKRVVYIDTIEDGDGNKRLCVFVEETQDCIEQDEIKSIVTKEQMKSVEYIVKE